MVVVIRVGVLVLCAMAQSAIAQPRNSDPQVAYLDQLTETGLLAMKRGDHELAIAAFEKANKLSPDPAFVLNMAQAHRLLWSAFKASDPTRAAFHRDAARQKYRELIAANPTAIYAQDPSIEAAVKERLAKLDDEWAVEHPKEVAAAAAEAERKRIAVIEAERARVAAVAKQQAARDQLERTRIAAATAATKRDNAQKNARLLRVSGAAAAGVGVASAALGVYFGVRANQLADEVSGTSQFDRSVYDDGLAADRNMTIAYIVGASLIVGGAVTYGIGRYRAPREVIVTPTAGGVLLQGRF